MNKLVIDKEILLKDYVGYVEIINDVDITISGVCEIYEIIKDKHYNINVILKENSKLKFNRFCLNPIDIGKVNINHEKSTTIEFNESLICKNNFELDINSIISESNVEDKVKIRIVAQNNSNIIIKAEGKVLQDTQDNNILEDLRCFNLDESKITIYPNLLVDSNEVIANHNATISNVNEEQLFYLNSKGINYKDAIILLQNGFALSIFDNDDFKEKVKNNI